MKCLGPLRKTDRTAADKGPSGSGSASLIGTNDQLHISICKDADGAGKRSDNVNVDGTYNHVGQPGSSVSKFGEDARQDRSKLSTAPTATGANAEGGGRGEKANESAKKRVVGAGDPKNGQRSHLALAMLRQSELISKAYLKHSIDEASLNGEWG